MVAYLQIDFVCPNCGTEGYGMWRPEEPARWMLVSSSPGLHDEPCRTRSGLHELVCGGCNEILTD